MWYLSRPWNPEHGTRNTAYHYYSFRNIKFHIYKLDLSLSQITHYAKISFVWMVDIVNGGFLFS
jgi:hypothetical protein